MPISKPMEKVVEREITKYLASQDLCDCPKCKDDILALALQNLPARYSTTLEGSVWINVELQSPQVRMDMLKAIIFATNKIKTNPRH